MTTDDPVVAQIQLGIHLRDLREQADRTAAEAATSLGCSAAKISKVENGKQGITVEDVAGLLEFYAADDPDSAEALRLAAVPKPRRRRGSRLTYREAVPQYARRYMALEAEASDISAYQSEFIPGLLQTPTYARWLMRAAAPHSGSKQVESKVELRSTRQRLLTREEPDPLRLDVILQEAALYRVIGYDDCMRDQLNHLAEMADLPNVRLRVLAFRPRTTANHYGSFVTQVPFQVLRLPERGSLVYIEDFTGGSYPEDATVIQQYAHAFERLGNASEDPESSCKLVAKVAMQYQ
jgi:transcriptional regulator with XRE-family HTH domain